MSSSARPAPDAVRRALHAILTSETFARSERLRSFLRYVVENALCGKAASLKGYSIGIDVFGRPEGFDAGNDPLVRVQAGKLRKLLEQYYETEGAGDALRIHVPRGSYVPEYEVLKREEVPPAESEARPAPPRRRRTRGSWLPAPVSSPLALFSLLPLFFLAPTAYPVLTRTAIGDTPFAITVQEKLAGALPRVRIVRCWPAGAECSALADAVADAAAYHRTVRLLDPDAADDIPALGYSVRVDSQPDGGAIYLRLVHEQSGTAIYARHLWREQLTSESGIAYEAVTFATRALAPNGLVYRHALRTGIASDLMRCLAGASGLSACRRHPSATVAEAAGQAHPQISR